MVPAALRRCGRFADGWLPSSCTPAEVAAARVVIDEAAAEAGRAICPEHFGVSIAYASGPLSPRVKSGRGLHPPRCRSRARSSRWASTGCAAMLERFLEVGFSKFVVRPIESPESWRAELEALADGVLDLQT